MNIIKRNNKYRLSFLCLFFLFPLFSGLITDAFNLMESNKNFSNQVNINERKDDISNFQEPRLDQLQDKESSFIKWKELTSKADQNENGIDDNFEVRLIQIHEHGFIEEDFNKETIKSVENKLYDDIFGVKSRKTNKITVDNIPIIISFPKKDYNNYLLLFEELGGNVKSIYDVAINGFGGSINYDNLIKFCSILNQKNTHFLIEEDRIYQVQLYYTGRNMNLRPYVWNNLSYDGDEYSSIAIVDTGIDDAHNFFDPGYNDANFNYKIVGWRDEVGFSSFPYDDNGHGSHCSGIATGKGSPDLDHLGRAVATTADFQELDKDYPETEGNYSYSWTRFNVTNPGIIDIEIEFNDTTPGPDDVDLWTYLYYGDFYSGGATMVDYYESISDSWAHNLSFSATSGDLGMYSFVISVNYVDNTGDGYLISSDIQFRSKIHWPFDPPQYGGGNPWKGIAPDTHLVGVKVLDQYGIGWSTDIISGINWIISNKEIYHIKTMSLSLGGDPGQTSFIAAVNNAVDEGIVTVVSAGNEGSGGNNIGSPGDADNVITVAANNVHDNITYYSSQGGSSYTSNTIKPDITAPGGSFFDLQMFSADTGDNDNHGEYSDWFEDDLFGTQGTSMSTPAVAGACNLLIEAMGGHESWEYTAIEAKRVKALLLMSATETYPLQREIYGSYSPTLDRGGKDVHEGYGRLNIDVAIEAIKQELIPGSYKNTWLTSSLINPFNKHGLGCFVDLEKGKTYNFTLDVPGGADFDLHLYNNIPSSTGEPIIVSSSTLTGLGQDENILYGASDTGKFFLIAKAISGEGMANISYNSFAHDLSVLLEVPENPELAKTYTINATINNNGVHAESNVEFNLLIDTKIVASTVIPSFLAGDSEIINYIWTPTKVKTYNFTTYALPVPSEQYLLNNNDTKLVAIFNNYTLFYDDFESGLSKWENITGLWHLTDFSSSNPDPYHSPLHGMWFGNESTGDYNTGKREMGNFTSVIIDLSNCLDAYLEFYHWRETENWDGYDRSYVYISTDGLNWNDIYYDCFSVVTWEKVILNISDYAGNKSVQIMFHFDTVDSLLNDYIGWVVDDVKIFTNQYIEFNPELTNGSVDPTVGYQSSLLNFSVNYTDKDNHEPSYVDVVLNGTSYSMGKQNPSDTNYTDGCLYQYLTYLQPSPYNYSYYFECSDGKLSNSTILYNDLQIQYSNSHVPTLSNGQVNPNIGYNGSTVFTFSVIYSDKDNNAPYSITVTIDSDIFSMKKQNPSDSNYMDGYVYKLKKILSKIGNYTFSFNCSDGLFFASIGPYSGPIVEEIILPSDFDLSTDADDPDNDGNFNLLWEASNGAVSYSVYEYHSYITVFNDSLTLKAGEITDLSLPLSGYTDGTYYFIVLALNEFGDTLSNCIEIVVEIPTPPGNFILSSDAGSPDNDGNFTLSWGASNGAVSYSIYEYSSYITEINSSITSLATNITSLSRLLTGYNNGTYHFIVVAHNAAGDTLSNCHLIVVEIPPGGHDDDGDGDGGSDRGIPGYPLYLLLTLLIVITAIIIKKKREKLSKL